MMGSATDALDPILKAFCPVSGLCFLFQRQEYVASKADFSIHRSAPSLTSLGASGEWVWPAWEPWWGDKNANRSTEWDVKGEAQVTGFSSQHGRDASCQREPRKKYSMPFRSLSAEILPPRELLAKP